LTTLLGIREPVTGPPWTSVLDCGRLPEGSAETEETTMYATVRTYAGNPDLADTLAEHEDEIRQVIGAIDGFKAYYLVKGGDATTSISVFEDQTGAEESNRAAAAWLAENLPNLGVGAPQMTAGDVRIGF
jgi:hypothetical protein